MRRSLLAHGAADGNRARAPESANDRLGLPGLGCDRHRTVRSDRIVGPRTRPRRRRSAEDDVRMGRRTVAGRVLRPARARGCDRRRRSATPTVGSCARSARRGRRPPRYGRPPGTDRRVRLVSGRGAPVGALGLPGAQTRRCDGGDRRCRTGARPHGSRSRDLARSAGGSGQLCSAPRARPLRLRGSRSVWARGRSRE